MLLNSVHNYTHFQGVILNWENLAEQLWFIRQSSSQKSESRDLVRQTCANVTCELLSPLKKAKIMYIIELATAKSVLQRQV